MISSPIVTWKQVVRQMEASARRQQRTAERDAVRRHRDLQKQYREMAKQSVQAQAAYEVQEFENYLDLVVSLHKDRGDVWSWQTVANAGPPAAPHPGSRNEAHAKHELEAYAPGFFERLFGGAKRRTSELEVELVRAQNADQAEFAKATHAYQAAYALWDYRRQLARRLLTQEMGAYPEALQHAGAFDELTSFQTQVTITEAEPTAIVLTCQTNSTSPVPTEELKLTAAGKVSTKAMAAGRYWALHQDFVCSMALRAAGEALAVLPIERVVVNVGSVPDEVQEDHRLRIRGADDVARKLGEHVTASAPPGWYADPSAPGSQRWWDGAAWTQAIQPSSAVVAPPAAVSVSDLDRVREQVAALRSEHAALEAQVVETRDVMLLQEVGIYEYRHPLASVVDYEAALATLQAAMKESVKANQAVTGTKKWAINGSEKEGARMVTDFSKLMLRAYNMEADNIVGNLRPYSLPSAVARLEKTRASISKLGVSMKIEITDRYHALRVQELELTADFQAKLAKEKEREREARARLKEEEAARREYEREQARLEKEKAHYEAAVNAMRMNGDQVAVGQAEEKLAEIQNAIEGVVQRAANIRAGYVYVISNIGAFGDSVVKIGMTRRLDPMDRVRELGDASVPFRFDVHALFFSADAVGVETALHQRFAKRRVNFVNAHREFFFVAPLEVKAALMDLQGNVLQFVEAPEALEWHQSQSIMKGQSLAAS